MCDWQPIETAPRDGSPFIALSPHGIFETWWECVDGGGHPEDGPAIYWWVGKGVEYLDGPYDAPTHWIPKPKTLRDPELDAIVQHQIDHGVII